MHRHFFHDNVPLKLGDELNIDEKQKQKKGQECELECFICFTTVLTRYHTVTPFDRSGKEAL